MVRSDFEWLVFSTEHCADSVKQAIFEAEALLKRLSALPLSENVAEKSGSDTEKTTTETKHILLSRLIDVLTDTKRQLDILLEAQSVFDGTMESDHDIVKQHAVRCNEIVKNICRIAGNALDDGIWAPDELSGIKKHLDMCKRYLSRVQEIYGDEIRKTQHEIQACSFSPARTRDSSSQTEVGFDCESRYSHASQACPPPPVAFSAVPLRQDKVIGMQEPPKKRKGFAPKTKKGIFGLFKHKKNTVSKKQTVPPPQIDSVRFSAVAPNKVRAGKYLPVNIVMYEDSFRSAVDDILRSHGRASKESKSGYFDIVRNSLIKVVLTSRDITVEDGVSEQRWNGGYLDFEFATKIPKDFSEEQILFSADIYINDIIATRLKLILDCQAAPKHNISVSRTDIVSAFVSYASHDRGLVAAIIQGMQKARPDLDIFFDIENLRSGEKWEETLKEEIEKRDILYLCWSKHAKDSKWVDMEWRYALETKGADCIDPIAIDSPDVCPPPAELQQMHFNDKMLYIIKASARNFSDGDVPQLLK